MSEQHFHEAGSSAEPTRGEFRVGVASGNFNFRDVVIADPRPTGRQVAEEAGFRPADEHLVFQVLDGGALEELRLDELVELRGHGAERFIIFRSERSFRLEVNERRQEWGASEVTGLLVKHIAGVDVKCNGVWLELRAEPDRFIGDGDTVTLAGEGLERFRTSPVFIVCIESKEFPWPKPTITTEEIARLGNWDPSLGVQEVNLMTGEARTLAPGAVVKLEHGKGFSKKIGWRRG
jgi:hypothetical protein